MEVVPMKKEKVRDDILTQTEKITGIPVREIIKTTLKGTGYSPNEIDEMCFSYETKGLIIKIVYDFAVFLQKEWLKENRKP